LLFATPGYHAWFGRKVQALELLMHAHALSSECSTQERVRGAHPMSGGWLQGRINYLMLWGTTTTTTTNNN
jgi:hypothetical protein